VTLSRRVMVDDDIPVTDVATQPECSSPTKKLVWHLEARRVPSIGVTLDRRSHRILYIRPTWDAPGATLVSQEWVVGSEPFLPGGD
jgi:hypothetical protein